MNGSDLTTVITLEGPKASMVKMLNAGILSLGRTNLINEGEDKETIKQKVTGDAIVFQFQDLLNGSGEPLPRERIPLDEDGRIIMKISASRWLKLQKPKKGSS